MKLNERIISFGLMLAGYSMLVGCAHHAPIPARDPDHLLSQLRLIRVGQADQREVRRILGEPQMKVSSEDMRQCKGNAENWLYFDRQPSAEARVYVSFELSTDRVCSLTWGSTENDGPIDLDWIKKRFPEAHWEAYDIPQTQHFVFDEVIYADIQRGLMVSLNSARRQADLSWMHPTSAIVSGMKKHEERKPSSGLK